MSGLGISFVYTCIQYVLSLCVFQNKVLTCSRVRSAVPVALRSGHAVSVRPPHRSEASSTFSRKPLYYVYIVVDPVYSILLNMIKLRRFAGGRAAPPGVGSRSGRVPPRCAAGLPTPGSGRPDRTDAGTRRRSTSCDTNTSPPPSHKHRSHPEVQ